MKRACKIASATSPNNRNRRRRERRKTFWLLLGGFLRQQFSSFFFGIWETPDVITRIMIVLNNIFSPFFLVLRGPSCKNNNGKQSKSSNSPDFLPFSLSCSSAVPSTASTHSGNGPSKSSPSRHNRRARRVISQLLFSAGMKGGGKGDDFVVVVRFPFLAACRNCLPIHSCDLNVIWVSPFSCSSQSGEPPAHLSPFHDNERRKTKDFLGGKERSDYQPRLVVVHLLRPRSRRTSPLPLSSHSPRQQSLRVDL